MANEDQIEELKALIKAKATSYQREKARIARLSPEDLAEYKRNRVKLSVEGVRRRKIRKATRPKPTRCEVCQLEEEIVYDHDHNSTAFRGWLCKSCNLALGYAKDDPILLEKLAVYLRTHGGTDA